MVYICDSICEKGAFGGNVNLRYGRGKRAKAIFHANAAYYIMRTYGVSPTVWPSLKPIVLWSVSNEDRTLSPLTVAVDHKVSVRTTPET